MMTSNVGPGELVRDLRATLEAISLGLIDGQPERLLDAESRLAELTARLATLAPSDIDAHRDAIVAARHELQRCERLGGTVLALNEVYAARRGYGPSGHFMASDAAGVLHARV
jgi:hypothetical protein